MSPNSLLLQKSTKDYKAMLGGDIESPHHKEIYETAKKMPNSNWGTWVIRNAKQNPEKFNEVKDQLHHFTGMTHIPEIANHRFEKEHDFDQGLNALKQHEAKHTEKFKDKTRFVTVPRTAKKIADVGNGQAWYSLNKPYCTAEGKAMGHCGNKPSATEHHDVLSLRTEHKINGKKYHEPHLTFINDKNHNILGEMKGKANEKPNPKYHNAIVKLLESGHVPFGGGYASKNNFHIDDLSPELQERVFQKNPAALLHSSNKERSIIAMEKLLERQNLPFNVKAHIAENPNLDPRHHEKLVNDEHRSVRQAIAENPNLDPRHHERLANDDHWFVREAIAKNPNVSQEILHKLLQDNDLGIRQTAEKALKDRGLIKSESLFGTKIQKSELQKSTKDPDHQNDLVKRCVVIIAQHNGKTVMGKLPNGKYKFPAGHVDEKEMPRDAAIRELKEETNLDAENLKCFAIEKHGSGHITYFFTCSPKGIMSSRRDPDEEFDQVALIDPWGVPEKDHVYPFRDQTIAKYLAGELAKSENIQKAAISNQNQKIIFHHILPKSSQGPESLHTVLAMSGGKLVGEMSAEPIGDKHFSANMVEVHPEHQGKGIATNMYRFLENKTKRTAIPDLEAMTADGKKFWQRPYKDRGFGLKDHQFDWQKLRIKTNLPEVGIA